MKAAFFAAAFVALAAPALPAAAAEVTGLWNTPTRSGVVEITRCGGSVCGRLVSSEGLKADPALKDVNNKDSALRGRALKGLLILDGFSGNAGTWTGGTIYNAEDGKTYSASLTLDGENALKVRGCVIAPLCQTQTWTRAR